MQEIGQQPLLKIIRGVFCLSMLLHGAMLTVELLMAHAKPEPNSSQPTAAERADWLKVRKFNVNPAKITASLQQLSKFYRLHCQTAEVSLKRRAQGIIFYEVNLTLSALSDRVLRKFINHLQGPLKPFVSLQTLRVLRVIKIKPAVLHAISEGKTPKIIEAQLTLEWVAYEKDSD